MKSNELVWRTLVDAAVQGSLHWENLADLAFQSGVPLTTTHLATKKLSEIGAILPYRSGGLSVIAPDKIATVLCAWRNLAKDTIAWTTRAAFEEFGKSGMPSAIGGAAAAIKILGDQNTVADAGLGLGYVAPAGVQWDWPQGDEIRILPLDARAQLDWDGFSSFAQTYADLFASPGWQASEFRLALKAQFLPDRNWEK